MNHTILFSTQNYISFPSQPRAVSPSKPSPSCWLSLCPQTVVSTFPIPSPKSKHQIQPTHATTLSKMLQDRSKARGWQWPLAQPQGHPCFGLATNTQSGLRTKEWKSRDMGRRGLGDTTQEEKAGICPSSSSSDVSKKLSLKNQPWDWNICVVFLKQTLSPVLHNMQVGVICILRNSQGEMLTEPQEVQQTCREETSPPWEGSGTNRSLSWP